MLTQEDIQKIAEVCATKEDIKEMREDINGLRESVQFLVISVDGLVKAISDLKTEYISITSQIDRHDKWIQLLAEKLNLKLEY
ncbi:hypothetical protein KJ591_00090 [Patescibacteria group bacterium]|nr:hypothetical protein [Patescibacteria group bacterium]MBU4022760.1 hypothetical protein [Patescibacteria group bacterium]